MKKVFGIFLTLILGLVLVACKPDNKPPAELTDKDIISAARTQLNIGTADELKNINSDFDIPLKTNVSGNEVTISWVSNNDAIKIDGDLAKVTLSDEDVNVKLTATLTYNEETATKEFDVVVLKIVSADNEVDNIEGAIMLFNELNDNEAKIEVSGEVIVIGTGEDGYVVADETNALLVYKGSGVEVGDKGHITASLNIPFGTNPQFTDAQFVKTGEKATKEEIYALAKERTVEEQLVKDYKDIDSTGFFKMHGKIVTKTEDEHTNPYIVSLEDETKSLVHYYKLEKHDEFIAVGEGESTKDGVDVYVFIYDYHSGQKEYRVGFYDVNVELNDEQKLDVVKAKLEGELSNNPLTIEGDINVLSFESDIEGVQITWDFTDQEDDNNKFVNLDTKKVTGEPVNKEVKLTATLKLNDEKRSVNIVVLVGLPELGADPVATIKAANKGDVVAVQGKIISKPDGDYTNYYFKSGNEEVQVFITNGNAGKETADIVRNAADTDKEVYIVGTVDEYKDVKQLSAKFYVVETR